MTSQLTAKIRLVKCPRCRRVLPELSNVPVYQCGGCDAVLQVKKRKNGTNGTGLHIYEPEITHQNEVQHDSEGTETPDETKVEEDPVNKIIEKGNEEIKQLDGFSSGRESFEAATREVEDDFDQFLLKKFSLNDHDELDSLSEFGHHVSEEPSPVSLAHCKSQEKNQQNKESSLIDESHDEVAEKGNTLRKKDGNDGVSSSKDLNCHESEDFSSETEFSGEFDKDAISRYIFGNFKKEKNPQRLSTESTSTENISPPHIEETTEVEPIISRETLENKELSENQNLSNQVFLPKELNCQELEDSSLVVTQKESKENILSRFVFRSLKKENQSSEENIASHNEQVEQPHSRKSSRCNSVSSEESLENVDFSHVDSTYISNDVHNASEALLGENEDHNHDQFMRELKGKSTENLPTSSYLDSFSREKKAFEPKGFTQGRPVRRWTQFKRDEQLSRENFCPRGFPTSYEYGSSSNHVKNHLYFDKNADFPPKLKDPEEEKMKLKKMVFELQDQLNSRTQIPKGYASCGLNHNGYPNSCYQREIFSDQYKFTRVPFSAEARPQMGHFCLQYPPHDWHCSAPLSPHLYSKPGQCTAHTNHTHYNSNCPCSELPVKNTNERGKITPKRHVLPLKGGAPFVVCDNCSNILQLPADFLLFKKRYHQLRCGSCSYMHKFWLRNGYILDRYTDNNVSGDLAPAPPPSEVDDFRDMNKGKKMSINCPHVDSLCVSEDYGPSICKSCSTEGDALSYDVQKRDLNRKKIISGGSVDHLNRRKNQFQQSVTIESQKIYNDGNSLTEKSSPTVAKLRGRDVSPLHRLMGYNSARDVFNRR